MLERSPESTNTDDVGLHTKYHNHNLYISGTKRSIDSYFVTISPTQWGQRSHTQNVWVFFFECRKLKFWACFSAQKNSLSEVANRNTERESGCDETFAKASRHY